MNLHWLRIFTAVVERRGFSRAAAAIHISQPAVSKAVRQLESRLGTPLLERGARPLKLTEAGQLLYGHARTIFAVERTAEAEAELRVFLGLERGMLQIGASTTIATHLLPPLLGTFT